MRRLFSLLSLTVVASLPRASLAQEPSSTSAVQEPPASAVQEPQPSAVQAPQPSVAQDAPPIPAPAPSSAVEPTVHEPVLWRRRWPQFSVAEGVGTLVAGAATGVFVLLKPPQNPRWRSGILFDDSVRDAVRLHSSTARSKALSLSELPYYTAGAIPLVIDPLVLWLVRGDGKAAINVELMGWEAFSYAGVLSFISNDIGQRQRPAATACHDSKTSSSCTTNTDSFYSGHTTIVAASAGLVCANHNYMPIYGNRVADLGTCALATTGAVASGVARLMGDQHYTTDVVLGFATGFAFGYGVPTLLHYTRGDSSDVSLSVTPGAPCTGACVKLSGSF